MDDLDRKILSLLAKNARMPVKEIAEQVSLTSPAVSSLTRTPMTTREILHPLPAADRNLITNMKG